MNINDGTRGVACVKSRSLARDFPRGMQRWVLWNGIPGRRLKLVGGCSHRPYRMFLKFCYYL